LDGTYPIIKSGDKIKFVQLKVPNPIHEDVIGWSEKLPPELGLLPFVDYDTMFEKTFLAPLQNILNPIGWSPQKKTSLDDFFC
jgi:DNA polymerase elongation subunit (family B)